jgi:hypothetical protein
MHSHECTFFSPPQLAQFSSVLIIIRLLSSYEIINVTSAYVQLLHAVFPNHPIYVSMHVMGQYQALVIDPYCDYICSSASLLSPLTRERGHVPRHITRFLLKLQRCDMYVQVHVHVRGDARSNSATVISEAKCVSKVQIRGHKWEASASGQLSVPRLRRPHRQAYCFCLSAHLPAGVPLRPRLTAAAGCALGPPVLPGWPSSVFTAVDVAWHAMPCHASRESNA